MYLESSIFLDTSAISLPSHPSNLLQVTVASWVDIHFPLTHNTLPHLNLHIPRGVDEPRTAYDLPKPPRTRPGIQGVHPPLYAGWRRGRVLAYVGAKPGLLPEFRASRFSRVVFRCKQRVGLLPRSAAGAPNFGGDFEKDDESIAQHPAKGRDNTVLFRSDDVGHVQNLFFEVDESTMGRLFVAAARGMQIWTAVKRQSCASSGPAQDSGRKLL